MSETSPTADIDMDGWTKVESRKKKTMRRNATPANGSSDAAKMASSSSSVPATVKDSFEQDFPRLPTSSQSKATVHPRPTHRSSTPSPKRSTFHKRPLSTPNQSPYKKTARKDISDVVTGSGRLIKDWVKAAKVVEKETKDMDESSLGQAGIENQAAEGGKETLGNGSNVGNEFNSKKMDGTSMMVDSEIDSLTYQAIGVEKGPAYMNENDLDQGVEERGVEGGSGGLGNDLDVVNEKNGSGNQDGMPMAVDQEDGTFTHHADGKEDAKVQLPLATQHAFASHETPHQQDDMVNQAHMQIDPQLLELAPHPFVTSTTAQNRWCKDDRTASAELGYRTNGYATPGSPSGSSRERNGSQFNAGRLGSAAESEYQSNRYAPLGFPSGSSQGGNQFQPNAEYRTPTSRFNFQTNRYDLPDFPSAPSQGRNEFQPNAEYIMPTSQFAFQTNHYDLPGFPSGPSHGRDEYQLNAGRVTPSGVNIGSRRGGGLGSTYKGSHGDIQEMESFGRENHMLESMYNDDAVTSDFNHRSSRSRSDKVSFSESDLSSLEEEDYQEEQPLASSSKVSGNGENGFESMKGKIPTSRYKKGVSHQKGGVPRQQDVYLFRFGQPVEEGFPCSSQQQAARVAFDISGRGAALSIFTLRRCMEQGTSWFGVRFCDSPDLSPEGTTRRTVRKYSVEVIDSRDGVSMVGSPFSTQKEAAVALGISLYLFHKAIEKRSLIQDRWRVSQNRGNEENEQVYHVWRLGKAGDWVEVVTSSSIDNVATCIGTSPGQAAYIVDQHKYIKHMAITTTSTPPDLDWISQPTEPREEHNYGGDSIDKDEVVDQSVDDVDRDCFSGEIYVWKDGSAFAQSPYSDIQLAASAVGERNVHKIEQILDSGLPLHPYNFTFSTTEKWRSSHSDSIHAWIFRPSTGTMVFDGTYFDHRRAKERYGIPLRRNLDLYVLSGSPYDRGLYFSLSSKTAPSKKEVPHGLFLWDSTTRSRVSHSPDLPDISRTINLISKTTFDTYAICNHIDCASLIQSRFLVTGAALYIPAFASADEHNLDPYHIAISSIQERRNLEVGERQQQELEYMQRKMVLEVEHGKRRLLEMRAADESRIASMREAQMRRKNDSSKAESSNGEEDSPDAAWGQGKGWIRRNIYVFKDGQPYLPAFPSTTLKDIRSKIKAGRGVQIPMYLETGRTWKGFSFSLTKIAPTPRSHGLIQEGQGLKKKSITVIDSQGTHYPGSPFTSTVAASKATNMSRSNMRKHRKAGSLWQDRWIIKDAEDITPSGPISRVYVWEFERGGRPQWSAYGDYATVRSAAAAIQEKDCNKFLDCQRLVRKQFAVTSTESPPKWTPYLRKAYLSAGTRAMLAATEVDEVDESESEMAGPAAS